MILHENIRELISVIVPVYKVEDYLEHCVESITNQTYQNLEIILVDDGSPDGCPALCDKWTQKDRRVKVIHSKNGGSARARNLALEIANGEYVAFCDADDVMHPEMLEILHRVSVEERADIVECMYSDLIGDVFSDFKGELKTEIYDSQSALEGNISGAYFGQVIWNKIYRAESIGKVRFIENKMIDDEFWTYRVIGNANKLAKINRKLYFYRQQDQSVMHRPYSEERLAAVEAHVNRHEFIMMKYPRLVDHSLLRLWFDCRYHGQMSEKYLSEKETKRNYAYLKKVLKKYPLRFPEMKSQPLKEKVWLVMEMVSLPLTCKLRNFLNVGF